MRVKRLQNTKKRIILNLLAQYDQYWGLETKLQETVFVFGGLNGYSKAIVHSYDFILVKLLLFCLVNLRLFSCKFMTLSSKLNKISFYFNVAASPVGRHNVHSVNYHGKEVKAQT